MTSDCKTDFFSVEGWSYIPAREILRMLGPNASLVEVWEEFVLTEASSPGIPGHAIVVGVISRGSASPMLSLLRGSQNKPFQMSCNAAAGEQYSLLSPPTVVSRYLQRKNAIDVERNRRTAEMEMERATTQNFIDSLTVGLKEKELVILALNKYGHSVSNLRIVRSFRRTHCMQCREKLDGEIHVLHCTRCAAIVCPTCGSCGCGDSRFASNNQKI